jgi:uncharacterized membrane protein
MAMTSGEQDHSSAKPREGHITVTLDVGRPMIVVLWALFVFLMGGVTGGSLFFLLRPPPPHGPRHGDRMGSGLPRNFARVMQRDHGLSDEQTAAIERIVQRYQPKFEKTSEDARAQLKADLEEMNEEILPLLTPDQREAHQELWRHMHDGRGPPPGPPPHGPPPPRGY